MHSGGEIDEEGGDMNKNATTISTNDESSSNVKKRSICQGLQSEQISSYINRTPAQFGGSRRVEIVACELFPKLFPKKFSRKKLNHEQKRKLNRALYAESTWQIDRNGRLHYFKYYY